MPADKFIPARWYTSTGGRTIRLIVLHDMEAPETVLTAENTAKFFQTTTRKASAHYCIDNDSIVQCVKDKDVAYHAPGANNDGIGYEHAGYARQTRDEWLDPFGQAMLRRSAALAAEHCKAYGLPIQFVDAAKLKTGAKGITTHWEVTKAYGKSTHTDPGPNFPIDAYLQWVRQATSGSTTPPSEPTKENGMYYLIVTQSRGDNWYLVTPDRKRVYMDTAANASLICADLGPYVKTGPWSQGSVSPVRWQEVTFATLTTPLRPGVDD